MEKIYIKGCTGEYVNTQFCVENDITIGRNPQKCQIVYSPAAQGISGVHCKVHVSGGSLFVTDLGSTNGTFLDNGTRLLPNSPVQLQNGQRFYLGNDQNTFGVQIMQDMQSVPQQAVQPVPFQQVQGAPPVQTKSGFMGKLGNNQKILIAAMLVAGVVIIGLVVRYNSLSSRYNDLNDSYGSLYDEYDNLNDSYDDLYDEYGDLYGAYDKEINKNLLERTVDTVGGWIDFVSKVMP